MVIEHSNHWVDLTEDIILQDGNQCTPKYTPSPENIHTPLLYQKYGFTHNGVLIGMDITAYIAAQYHTHLLTTLEMRQDTGWIEKELNQIKTYKQHISQSDILHEILTYHANSWTQILYKNKTLSKQTYNITHDHRNNQHGITEQMKNAHYATQSLKSGNHRTSPHTVYTTPNKDHPKLGKSEHTQHPNTTKTTSQ